MQVVESVPSGKLGFGSYNDAASFDNVTLTNLGAGGVPTAVRKVQLSAAIKKMTFSDSSKKITLSD